MDSIRGAIALRDYIGARDREGAVDPIPQAPAEPSSLPLVDAWVRAFHESGQEVIHP
jgi:hypothetical protein